MSICLSEGSEVVLNLMCTVPIVFHGVAGHAVTQDITCYIIKNCPMM